VISQVELKLKSDTAKRKRFFTAESFAHPAKCHLGLLEWIVFTYTSEGETILDPMLGSGTVLYATLMGRSVVGVELESKFIRMAEDNLKKLNQMPLYLGVGQRGQAQIIQGDARNLEGILADKVVFSPPYSGSRLSGDSEETKRENEEIWGRQFGGSYNMRHGYNPDNPNNIGNLPYGQVDKIISSPPYEGSDVSQTHMTSNKRGNPDDPNYRPSWKRKLAEGYADSKRPYHQVDKIVTSPLVDAILTSPPYEGALTSSSQHGNTGIAADNPKLADTGRYKAENQNNIGNLKGGQDLLMDRRDYVIIDSRDLLKENSLCLINTSVKNVGIQATVDDAVSVTWQTPIKWFTLRNEIERYLKSCVEDQSQEEAIALTGQAAELSGEELIGSAYILKLRSGIIGLVVYAERPIEGKSLFIISSLGSLEGLQNCLTSLLCAEVAMIKHTDLGSGNIWCSAKYAEGNTRVAILYLEPVPLNAKLDSTLSNTIGGKLRKPTYISEMYQVYKGCYSVLKPTGGLLILVTKNFIRNKQIVRLDTDTIKLCEQAGFTYLERHYRKLPAQSFWRILYHRNYPSVPIIDCEDILVFVKEFVKCWTMK